jgi:hypothetical protein
MKSEGGGVGKQLINPVAITHYMEICAAIKAHGPFADGAEFRVFVRAEARKAEEKLPTPLEFQLGWHRRFWEEQKARQAE